VVPAVSLFVEGDPRPKGSLSPTLAHGARADSKGTQRCPHCRKPVRVVLREAVEGSAHWRRMVALAVGSLWRADPMAGPVAVTMTFWFDRASYLGPMAQESEEPIAQYIGDTDKLVRNVLDALTDASVYVDDRQVTQVVAVKAWAPPLTKAGVAIVVWER
jgi:Holliday junction resolvase RusA-like endonuclease